MLLKLFSSCLFISTTIVVASPQRNQPTRERRPTGQEFVDLLPDDFTIEEYESLLDEFVVSGETFII